MAKTYVGSGKKKSATWLKASINVDKIKNHIQEFSGNRFIKVDINILDKPDQYGKDVSITIDEYKPEKKEDDSLPF